MTNQRRFVFDIIFLSAAISFLALFVILQPSEVGFCFLVRTSPLVIPAEAGI